MPSASFLFSAVFSFQKSYTGNILGIARDENPPSYISVTYTDTKGETEGAVEPPHHLVAWVPHPAREYMVWDPQASPGVTLSPINTSLTENSKHPIRIPRKVPSPQSSSTLDREGSGALPGTLPEGRSSPEGSTSPCLPPE